MDNGENQYSPARPSAPDAGVEIPAESLSEEALIGVIDDFILREGTDYGATEVSHDRKRERIRAQLQKKKIVIVFEAASESVTLLTSPEWQKLKLKLQGSAATCGPGIESPTR